MENRKNDFRGVDLDKISDKVWLTYFNDYLFSKGLISQDKRRKAEKEINRLYGD
jgi:hypothetical protein